MNVLVTGATGLIGRALIDRLLERGDHVRVLSRDPDAARVLLPAGVRAFPWDPKREDPPTLAVAGVDAVVHLAGEPIAAGRWSVARKREIVESRVEPTRRLAMALAAQRVKTKVLVSASAVGFYGNRGDEAVLEDAARGSGFLADVCAAWEDAARPAADAGIRVVHPRIGIVLAREGGALPKMALPFRFGAGGTLGSGTQWFPWIHLDDVVGLLIHAIDQSSVRGAMNTTAPIPVTNRELTRTLGRALHRPAVAAVPRIALKLAMGEMAEMLLGGQYALPAKALETGYRFRFSTLDDALADLFPAKDAARAHKEKAA